MCHSKILQFLVSASIFAFSSTILATVLDLGNLNTISGRNSVSGLNIQESTYSGLASVDSAADFHGKNYSPSGRAYGGSHLADSYNEHDFQNNTYVALSVKPLGQEGQNKQDDNTAIPPLRGYATVTAPIPEPETYAMILAGLAMIVFTARRRS